MSINNKTLDNNIVINSLLWKIIERFFSQGVNLLIQIVLARLLMPEEFGSLAIMVAMINYANIFVQSGLGTALIQKKEIDKKDISTLLSISLFTALIMYIVLFTISPYIGNYYSNMDIVLPLRILSLTLFLNSLNSIQTAILSRNMDFKFLCLRSVIAVPLSGLVAIVMAYNGFGLWSLVAQVLLNNILIVLFMSFDKELRFKLGFCLERAKSFYSFSTNILLTSIVTGFHDTFRAMLIAKYYTKSDLAYFDKAVTYSSYVTQIVIQSLSSVLLPTFSKQQDNINELKESSRKAISLIAFIIFPVLVLVAMFSDELVQFVLTEKWLPCVPFLSLYCFLRMPGCIVVIDKQVLYALGKVEIILYYEVGLFVLNLSVLYHTISISTYAVALGATIVEFIGTFIVCIIASNIYKYKIQERLRDIYRPFVYLLCLVPLKQLTFINNQKADLFVKIIAFCIIYNGLAYITRDANLIYIIKIIKLKIKKRRL